MDWSEDQRAAIRSQILGSLDYAEEKLRETIARKQPLMRDGQVVTDPATGEPVPDLALVRDAEQKLAAVRQQRDEILGTGGDNVDLNITRLIEELDRRAAAGDDPAAHRGREQRQTSTAGCGTVTIEVLPQSRGPEALGITLNPWKCSAAECGNDAAWLLTACPGTGHEGGVLICDEHSANARQAMLEQASRPH